MGIAFYIGANKCGFNLPHTLLIIAAVPEPFYKNLENQFYNGFYYLLL